MDTVKIIRLQDAMDIMEDIHEKSETLLKIIETKETAGDMDETTRWLKRYCMDIRSAAGDAMITLDHA